MAESSSRDDARETLRYTFDQVAALYDRARPKLSRATLRQSIRSRESRAGDEGIGNRMWNGTGLSPSYPARLSARAPGTR